MHNVSPFIRRRMALTSLIDVIFLLLLFFMLSSTFSTFGEIELGQATAGVTKSSAVSNPAFVQLGVDRLVLNGNATTFERLVAEINVDQLLISLDQDTSAQRLVDLLVLLRGHTDLSVTVLE